MIGKKMRLYMYSEGNLHFCIVISLPLVKLKQNKACIIFKVFK